MANSSLSEASAEWAAGKRTSRLAKWLRDQGYARESLYTKTAVAGTVVYAFADDICQLILEFYAFEAASQPEAARQNYRKLSRGGLRFFVYHALGYDPANAVPPAWRQFHDRLLLHSAPAGYFSVFKESSDFVLAAIRQGLQVDEHTIPDISVGQAWSAYWESNDLAAKYGAREKYDHNYPDYFPQAASNPQRIAVYPIQALGEFRLWLQNTYVPQKFPAYLDRKVEQGLLPPAVAELLLVDAAAPELKALPENA